ncbi:MAG: 1-acyl-sn-glycerol-3-phosphate acyltransferase [Lentisphaeria bacterium]|nr:1-acyl-sn-glycerol-3-phosphate acyltransferase [Lentisphaeria bacterium]
MVREGFLAETPFTEDSYDTPENYPRSIWEYICLGTRLSFYIRNFHVFYNSGKHCRMGDFDFQFKADNSLKNVRITESCGGKVHLRGLNNLSRFPGPAVIVSNHMSLLETACLHAFVMPRRDFCFVIKRTLFDIPYFGDIMKDIDCIAVDRVNPREDFKVVMEEGKKRLDAGRSVIIFPQHTRSEVFDPEGFNTIGVKLARHASVPIIPLALRTDFLANGKLIRDMGPIRRNCPVWFKFGEPIMSVEGNGKAEQSKIIEFIAQNVKEWGGKVKEK